MTSQPERHIASFGAGTRPPDDDVRAAVNTINEYLAEGGQVNLWDVSPYYDSRRRNKLASHAYRLQVPCSRRIH